MDINQTFNFLNFIVNKQQSGNITPSQFNIIAERSQIDFFNKEYMKFQLTREVTDALSPFLVPTIINPDSSGQFVYPSDYYHVASVRHLYYVNNIAVPVPVEEITNNELGEMLMSQVAPATTKYPKVSYYDSYLQFFPKSVKAIQFDYLRRPVTPVWAYTVVNGRPVYDPTLSVNLEVYDEFQNEIVAMMLSLYGANISSQQVVQFSQLMKSETA